LSFQPENSSELTSVGRIADRELILDGLSAAVNEVSPMRLLERKLKVKGDILTVSANKFDLSKFDRVIVVGAGKASGFLAQSFERLVGVDRIEKGYVNILRGTSTFFHTRKIVLNEASHPVPNAAGFYGARQIVKLVSSAGSRDFVVCLISGGGSALLPYPPENISLRDIVKTTEMLLKAGATIDELNCVRRHVSLVKGGQLVRRAASHPTFLSLIISDVVGDDLSSIASGPTAPDPTFFGDALQILRRYHIEKDIPTSVLSHIRQGQSHRIDETPKPGDTIFRKVSNIIIANNSDACFAAMQKLKRASRSIQYLGSSWIGEADSLAKNLSGQFCEGNFGGGSRRMIFVWGGESTVTVRGSGKGGRNQQQALSSIEQIARCPSRYMTLAFLGTDGVDGNSESAGALVDSDSLKRATRKKLSIEGFLRNNDSNTFFEKLGASLINTGPTGTNVNDIGIAIVDGRSRSGPYR
jgi:glycerate 2-kinase